MLSCQQGELYAAERHVKEGVPFESPLEIQRWVDGMRSEPWWQMTYPQVKRVEVHWRDRRTNESVGSWHPELGAGKIEMLRVHWRPLVVLHELAHVLADARYGSHAHDPSFARTYLELVSLIMGPETYTALYDAFTSHGIDHDVDEPMLGMGRRMPASA